MTVDNLKQDSGMPLQRLDTFFKLSEGVASDKEEEERDIDGRDWTAMHFKKRKDKANPNTGKTKQIYKGRKTEVNRNQDLSILKSKDPTTLEKIKKEKIRDQRKIEITLSKLKTKTIDSGDFTKRSIDAVEE